MPVRCFLAKKYLEARSEPRDVRPERRFFPRSKLDAFLDEIAIETILRCDCDQCKSHLVDLGKHDPPVKYVKQIAGKNSRGAKALFALLISIDHPMFIVAFMERGLDDISTIESCCKQPQQLLLSRPELLHQYWPRFHSRHQNESHELVRAFAYKMHQFAPPILDHEAFSAYSGDTIMPFVEERELGSGAYGTVYSFEIYDGYNMFPVCLHSYLSPCSLLMFPNVACRKRHEIRTEAAE